MLEGMDLMFHLFSNRDDKLSYSDFIAGMVILKEDLNEDIIRKAFLISSGGHHE
jgi:hypothetical protein